MDQRKPLPQYQVFAVRYATRDARRRDHFIGGDPHEAPMPMDYFVWFIRGEGRTVVVDTGFTADMAARRRRRLLGSPIDLLARCGVDAATVADVVITHLHYDHAGNLPAFPAATFHLQEREMAFATGRYMCHHSQNHSYEAEDVVEMVRLLYKNRLRFHDGSAELSRAARASPCTGWAATPTACNACGCTPRAAGWCWRPTCRISTRT